MKNGWQWKQLGEVCKTGSGGTPLKAKKEHYEGGTIPWLMSGEVSQGEVREATNFITQKGLENSSARLFPKNTVLVAMYGATAGQVGILRFEAATNQAVCGILPSKQFLPEFLFYFLLSKKDELVALAVGNAQPNISQIKIRNTDVPLAPIPEQQRIVGVLDETFEGIATAKANAEKNLQNARALFDSHVQFVFAQRGAGWVEKKLSDVCAVTSTLVDPRKKDFLDLVHVGAGNIESKTGVFVQLKTAREEALISGKFLFDESMVLYSKIRPYLMKVARPDFNGLCSADMYPLTPLPNQITRDYLFHLLLSKTFTDYAIQGSARAGMPKVNRNHLFEFRLWLPPVKQQKELAATLNRLREETQNLESLYQRKLAGLEELKKSLLHSAFADELSAQSRKSVVIPFPTSMPNITSTDLHAGILAIAYELHEKNQKQSYFGHVKAEKIAHMIEVHLGIDLERKPIKDAAGPNDYPRLKRVEHRAKKAGFFLFQESAEAGYRITKYRGFNGLIDRTRVALGDRNSDVDALLELMLPLKTKQAEILATVYAAWNNLLLDKQLITDEAIVFEARENWHPDKLEIRRNRFFDAIKWMKAKGVIPTGKGKKVSAKLTKKR
jgi:type I restriction enzyme S subunit